MIHRSKERYSIWFYVMFILSMFVMIVSVVFSDFHFTNNLTLLSGVAMILTLSFALHYDD